MQNEYLYHKIAACQAIRHIKNYECSSIFITSCCF